jgi:RimJ/RimL family protein N-acetyltransferase
VSDALVRAPFTLETPRLQLVAPTPSDADAIFERYAGDADVTRYVGWPRHRTVADTRAFLAFRTTAACSAARGSVARDQAMR